MSKGKILLAGIGFIGTNFLKMFKDKYRIDVIDSFDYPCTANNGLLDFKFDGSLIRADIEKYETIKFLIEEFKPDYIINMAAKSHVDRSVHDTESFLRTNTIGVENILKIIKGTNIRLVQFSTDEVYGDLDYSDYYEFEEDDLLSPSSPYSASKAAADMMVSAYHRTYGIDVVTVRPTNNYGPYQYPEKLIPFIIKRIAEGKTIPIYGDGRNEREWLFVEDCCRAVETVMLNGKSGEIYNIGAGQESRNSNVFIAGFLDESNERFEFVTDRPGHDRKYAVNSKKINKLGWEPQVTVKDGLKLTKEWYLQRLDIIKSMEANKHIK